MGGGGAAPKAVMFDLMLDTVWGKAVVCGTKDRCGLIARGTKDPDGDRALMAGRLRAIAVCGTKDVGGDTTLMLGKFAAIAVCGTKLLLRALMLGKLLPSMAPITGRGTLSGTCSWT